MEAIVYTSNTGTTKEYAVLLGQHTGMPVYSLEDAKGTITNGTDIIYLGWVMASKVQGYDKASKRYKVRAVCGVCMGATGTQVEEIRAKNQIPKEIEVFTLQGGFDIGKLHGIYKMMMKVMVKTAGKELAEKKDRTPDEDDMLEMMLHGANHVSEINMNALLEWYNNNDYIIRNERKEEYRDVENMVRESFWNVYRPGCLEHYVLNQLRNDPAFIPELDFVMEKDGKIIGQCIYMNANIQADDGRTIPIMTMGPIGIAPEYKRQGYGKILLDYSLAKAMEAGCKAVCFEGNIDFYGKSGFAPASEFGIRYHGVAEGEDASFFLCKELIQGYLDGITGEYATPAGYFVDEDETKLFDKEFPYKEKLKLSGQLF